MSNPDYKPIVENGYPVCDCGKNGCRYYKKDKQREICQKTSRTTFPGATCIPQLRVDRDQAIKERDSLCCCANCKYYIHIALDQECPKSANEIFGDEKCEDWQPRPGIFEGGE